MVVYDNDGFVCDYFGRRKVVLPSKPVKKIDGPTLEERTFPEENELIFFNDNEIVDNYFGRRKVVLPSKPVKKIGKNYFY